MNDLTQIDNRMIALLRKDGRASITTIAADLGVSRATAQARLARLTESGIIHRFTVDVDASVNADAVRAVMLVAVEGTKARSVVAALKRLPEVASLHTTNGQWDLVATVETTTLPEFDRVLREVREVKGVLNSQTNILLNRAVG